MGQSLSSSFSCRYGVPQGSVLGSLLFTVYVCPISHLTTAHNIDLYQYADDAQLLIALTPSSYSPNISCLKCCLTSLHSWFLQNGLALNPSKTESILLGTRQRLASFTNLSSIAVADSSISLSPHIKTLGVILDSHLSFDNHVRTISRSVMGSIRVLPTHTLRIIG